MNSITIAQKVRTIDLTECLSDITTNVIFDSEHYLLPSNIFEDAILEALSDLVDDFAQNPTNYIKPHHQAKIDQIAHDYLNS